MREISLRERIFYSFAPVFFIYAAMAGIVFDKKSIMSILIVGYYFIFIVVYVIKYYQRKKFLTPMFFFIFYLFVLIFFSSEFAYSLKNFTKSVIPLLFFPISYIIVSDISKLRKLNRSMVLLIMLFVFNIIIANIFDLGKSQYGDEETIDIGNIYTTGLNAMSYVLTALPLIFILNYKNRPFQRNIVFLFSLASLIIMIILLKRASLLALVVGYFVLFLFQSDKKKLVKYLIIIALGLASLFPLYSNYFYERFEVREDRLQINSYEREGRYLEVFLVLEEMDILNKPIRTIFGREMFNSPGNYGYGIWGDRQLHDDYMRILNGSGFLGLFLFFLFNYYIFREFQKKRKIVRRYKLLDKTLFNLLNSLFVSFFVIYFVIGLSGGLDGTLYTSIRFIYLGAILGIFQSQIDQKDREIRMNNQLERSKIK